MSKKNDEVKCYNDIMSQLLPALGARYSVKDKSKARYAYIATMLDRLQQMFKWSGLPDTIPADKLELLLMINGYAAVTDVPGKGLYAFFGGLGGTPDAYYMPTICTINNPALGFNKNCNIGSDCAVVKNDSMYMGVMPMSAKYAELLTENDITFRTMSINSRIASVISASDDRTAAAAKDYIKNIEAGDLGVVGESDFFDGIRVQPTASGSRDNVIDLIEYNQYLKAQWFNDLGIQMNFNMKRERLNSDEVQLNIKGLLPFAENMLKCRKDGADEINKLFGTDISVEFAGVWADTAEEVEDIDQLDGESEEQPAEAEDQTEEVNENV